MSSSGPASTRPAAFGIGGGGGNKKPPSSNNIGDAVASAAAAEAEAAAAKVGGSASEAVEGALSAEAAAEAVEAGAAAAAAAAEVASSALSPAPAATSSLPPAPVRSAGAGRAQAAAGGGKKGPSRSLPQFARQLQQQQRRPTTLAGRRARGFARVLLYAGVAYALLSLGAAVMRVARRANSPRAQRLRTVDRNKRVVETLNAVFLAAPSAPDAPASTSSSSSFSSAAAVGLTPALMRKLRSETGFSGAEVFRKYLWYLLRERRFDSTAVADLVALRRALELSDEEVASALKERAQRIYDKVRNEEKEKGGSRSLKRGRKVGERKKCVRVGGGGGGGGGGVGRRVVSSSFPQNLLFQNSPRNQKKNPKTLCSTATSCSTSPG